MGAPGYDNGFQLSLLSDRLEQPLRRRKPTLYFVDSMSDLFHEGIPDAFLHRVFSVIERTPHHTYQILTKRWDRLPRYFAGGAAPGNAWLGVSVEDRRHGVPRIRDLREVDCAVRFISPEPLLEDLGEIDLGGIHWVITGGESGPKARPRTSMGNVNVTMLPFSSNNGADGGPTANAAPRRPTDGASTVESGMRRRRWFSPDHGLSAKQEDKVCPS